MPFNLLVLACLTYVAFLFAIAFAVERRAQRGGELPGAGRLYVVTGSGLRVRNAPGTDGDVLGKLDAGVAVRAIQSGPEDTIGGATNIWFYVVAPGGLVGWVFGQFLARK